MAKVATPVIGKRMKAQSEKLDKGRVYTQEEAVPLAIDTSAVKFDASVEVHSDLESILKRETSRSVELLHFLMVQESQSV